MIDKDWSRLITITLLLLLAACTRQTPQSPSQFDPVDFRYRPYKWQTAIGLPYDWLKTTVTQDAALAYDYAPGPYATPLTEIHLRSNGATYVVDTIRWSETTHGAVEAVLKADNGANRIDLKLLRYADSSYHSASMNGGLDTVPGLASRAGALRETPFRRRETNFNMTLGWVQPPDGTDPLFRNVAWGPNRAIVYEVAVPKGASRTVVLGWADSRYDRPKMRVLIGVVEGARDQEADPVGEAGKNGPVVRMFHARDVDGDGWIRIESRASLNGLEPNTILNGIWVFEPGIQVSDAEVISGAARAKAELVVDCGNDTRWFEAGITDLISGTFEKTATPEIFVKTGRSLTWDETRGSLLLEGRPMVTSVPAATGFREVDGGYVMTLSEATEVLVAVHHGKDPIGLTGLGDLAKAEKALDAYWTHHRDSIPLPYQIPDPSLQYIADASRDNFYRMADWVEGRHLWHTGPSVYRGLWIGDATSFLQHALFTGDTTGARMYLEGFEPYIQPSGQVLVMVPHEFHRETGNYIQQMAMYADLSGDDQWLLNRWHQVQKGMAYLKSVRERTMKDPDAVNYGLYPPALADGGVGGMVPEYGSTYYVLLGTKMILRTAERLGKGNDPEVAEWRSFYDELHASFRTAAGRDMRKDGGDWFLPIRVGETDSTISPTLASWGVVEAARYLSIFDTDDSLAQGTMNILTRHVEQGLSVGTGWVAGGLWPWFSLMQISAHLNLDRPGDATPLLYAVANHANPLGTWVEEQMPRDKGERTGGDQSNIVGSSNWLSAIRRMLVNERPDGLHLFHAPPAEWFGPGDVVNIDRTLTEYGPMTLRTEASKDGQTLTVSWDLQVREGRQAPTVILHTDAFAEAGFDVGGLGESGTSGEVVLRKK